MKVLKTSLVIVLCALIMVSTLLMLSAAFLRTTVFKDDFYEQVISSTAYLPLVRASIEKDLVFLVLADVVGVVAVRKVRKVKA